MSETDIYFLAKIEFAGPLSIAATPVPLKPTSSGELAAFDVNTMLSVFNPGGVVGVKVAVTVQLPEGVIVCPDRLQVPPLMAN
jgi:hypothetical protein